MLKGKNFMENLMRENSLKGIFGVLKKEDTWEEEEISEDSAEDGSGSSSRSRKWVRELSSLANVVASRCAK